MHLSRYFQQKVGQRKLGRDELHQLTVTSSLTMLQNLKTLILVEQAWLRPYKTPGIVGSGSYDITIVCGPRDMRLQNYNLISQKIKAP